VEPDAKDVARLLREAAAAGIVLLANSRALLPLDRASVRRVAVLGPDAATGWVCGGGSCGVAVRRATSPTAGLTAALDGHGSVDHAEGVAGVDRLTPVPDTVATCPECGEPGFAVRYRDASGQPIRTEHRRSGRLAWFGDDIVRGATIELAATLRADVTGSWHIGFAAVGELTLVVDGEIAVHEVIEPKSAGFASSFLDPPERHTARRLDEGQTVDVVLRLVDLAPSEGFAALTLGVRRPRLPPDEELARAVDLARAADTCIVVVGTGPQVESEGRDRVTLALPGAQDDLVRAVAAVNPRTVVVVNAGAPVLLPWRDRVAAVVVAWFPGQEFGTALADVLFGLADPGGRLPCTWPDRDDQAPVLSTRPVDGVLHYAEGVHVGHRAWLRDGEQPAYPFGHGLSYTEWTYVHLGAPATVRRDSAMTVRIHLRNTGSRLGKEVVQVYLSRPESDLERPVRWLAGFTVVRAAPGADVVAEVQVAARAFQHWSASGRRWTTEPGGFALLAGRSVSDLRLVARIDVV
jgi:beta-glucosidase